MQISKLYMRNFMPFHDEHEVDFPGSGQRNVMLVWGHNEHGKTSLLNAVRWCLFGYALGRHRKQYDLVDILNIDAREAGDWSMSVRLTFTADGDNYDLVRAVTLRPLVKHAKRDSDFDIAIEMKRNGNPLSEKEINRRLTRLMPEPVSRFHLFDGELLQEYEDLLSEDTSEIREIKDAIERVLGIPALVQGRDELKSLAKGAKKTQAQENQKVDASNAAATRQLEVQGQMEVVQKDLEHQREQIRELVAELENDEKFLAAQQAALSAQDDVELLERETDELKGKLAELRVTKADALADVWQDILATQAAGRVKELRKSVQSRDDGLRLAGRLEARVDLLKARMAGEPCGVCGTLSELSEGRDLESDLSAVEASLGSLQTEMALEEDVMQRLTALRSISMSGAAGRLRQVERKAATALVRQTQIEGDLDELQTQIAGFDSAEAQSVRGRLPQKQKLQGRFEEQERGIVAQLDNLSEEEDELSRLMARQSGDAAQRANREANILTGLGDLFAQAVGDFRERVLSEVEEAASETFLTLTAESAYKGLKINKNYGLSIIDDRDRVVTLRSSGAEQIVALALIRALNRTGRSQGPLIVDTPFGRLDPRHREKILTALPGFGRQVVLLAHEGELSSEMAADCIGDRIALQYELVKESPSRSRLVSRDEL